MVTHCVGEVNNMTSQVVTASGGGSLSPAASPLPTQIDTASITTPPSPTVNITQPQQRRSNENRRVRFTIFFYIIYFMQNKPDYCIHS